MKLDSPGGRTAAGLRWAAAVVAVAIPLGLWFGGTQPVAVGLIPSPWDKLAHTAVFAMLAATIGWASGLRGAYMAVLALTGALLVGAADEWHQLRLPGRNAGWDDFAADGLGALLGAAAVARWQQRHAQRRAGAAMGP